jgi:xanthine dehydrogenase accessory factor
MQGFVGGSCSREIVRKQALEALAVGKPRLVQIRPDGLPEDYSPNAEHVMVPMSCASEGAVDVYIEPYQRPPLLLVVGLTPIAEALVRLGLAMEYEVVQVVEEAEQGDLEPSSAKVVKLEQLPDYLAALPMEARSLLMAVVVSQGHYDEPALEVLLKAHPIYLGLLSSRKRGQTVRELLSGMGFEAAAVAAIRNPVGLDIGAKTPAEVAVSILAELVQMRPKLQPAATELSLPVQPAKAIDPVCGMEVEVATAKHHSEYQGQHYYFCCPHCKARFEKEPVKYLAGEGIR